MGQSRDPLTTGGYVVAGVLLLTFLIASFSVMSTVNSPPLLADPAPTGPPAVICPWPGSSSSGSSTPAAVGSPATGARDPSLAGSTDGAAGITAGGTTGTSSGASAESALSVACQPGEVVYAPQLRGSYDPSTRLMALLGIVVPLLSTIVAFFFGQRAGQAAGEAETQRIVTRVAGASSSELSEIQQFLRKGGKYDADRTSLGRSEPRPGVGLSHRQRSDRVRVSTRRGVLGR
ncbi:hypothetical protein [Terrabacter sp. BE26]|uniref:hypothetical protein n=1 Tax=Terrabacter sp. BE26 TaxID=2898152 RepID=UPI0035BE218C